MINIPVTGTYVFYLNEYLICLHATPRVDNVRIYNLYCCERIHRINTSFSHLSLASYCATYETSIALNVTPQNEENFIEKNIKI